MTVGSRQNIIAPKVMTLNIYDKSIEKKTTRKLLGVHIDETMSWDNQISHIITKVQNGLRMLYKTRSLTNDLGTLNSVYRSLVQQYFNYCSIVWGNCSKTRADQLQKLQNRAARIITKADYSIRSCDILEELRWPTLNDRRTMQMNIMMYKVCHVAVPEYLTELSSIGDGGSSAFLRNCAVTKAIPYATFPFNGKLNRSIKWFPHSALIFLRSYFGLVFWSRISVSYFGLVFYAKIF